MTSISRDTVINDQKSTNDDNVNTPISTKRERPTTSPEDDEINFNIQQLRANSSKI